MTLHTYPELEQGSDEWLAARCGVLTASNIGKLITPTLKVANNETSRALALTIAAERITGRVDPIYITADMQRGALDEPFARALYSEHFEPVDELGFAVRESDGVRVGASPDGLVGDVGGIEVKSRRQNVQVRTILSGEVPAANMAQIQCCLYVFDREWWDFISYAGGMPLYVKRVFPTPEWQVAIRDAAEDCEGRINEILDVYGERVQLLPIAPLVDHFADLEIA